MNPVRVRQPFAVLAALLSLAILGAIAALPFLNEIPSHLRDAHRIAGGQFSVTGIYRLPIGYSGFLAALTRFLTDAAAVKVANGLAFAAFAILAVRYLQASGATRPKQAGLFLFAVLLLALHPYTLLSIVRANETMLAAAVLMGFMLAISGPASLGRVAASGALLGLFIHVRANAISLLACTAVWLVAETLAARRVSARRAAVLFALALVATLATYMAVSAAITGIPSYRPTNGGYNLYAGNNPFSAAEIARNQNAEYSLAPALRAAGFPADVDPKAVSQEQFVQLAGRFAREHPGQVAWLTARKAVLFVEPRLANADSGAKVLFQCLAVVPFVAALGLIAWSFATRRRWVDGAMLLMALAYAAPFWVTNSDPRMRFPVDLVLMVRAIALLLRRETGFHSDTSAASLVDSRPGHRRHYR